MRLNLLGPRCVFCGYNGPGFYQEGTHDKECPWHLVGGAEEREAALPVVINLMYNALVAQSDDPYAEVTAMGDDHRTYVRTKPNSPI